MCLILDKACRTELHHLSQRLNPYLITITIFIVLFFSLLFAAEDSLLFVQLHVILQVPHKKNMILLLLLVLIIYGGAPVRKM